MARSEFGLGWKPLVAALLGVACGASPIPFNVVAFLMKPLGTEFGWSRAEVALGITVFGLVAAPLAPVYGWLADRVGVRPVALWSLFGFGLAFAAFALTPPALAGYYGLWFVLGLIGIGSTPVTWSRAIPQWFVRHRGLALGIMLLGSSLAAFVVPGLATWAIGRFGWRGMFPIVALLPLLVALPVAFAWFREPRPEERPAGLTHRAALPGRTLGEAVRDYRFWVLFSSIATVALAYGGAHINLPLIVGDHGLGGAESTAIMGVVGLGILIGRIVVGLLLDRFWGPAVAFPVLLLPALSCWLLLGTDAALVRVTVAGFLLGFAAGAESDLIAFFAARYFGLAHYGKIYGLLYMPFGLGSAISPVVYARVRDVAGSYDPALATAALAFIAGGALLLTLGRYPAATPPLAAEPATA